MIKYTCKSCNITTELSECPHCGERTEIVNSTIYWCKFCNIPTFDEHCPICGSKGKRIGSDIRPVFPQERLLLEILLDCPLKYKNSSVWNTAGNYYYADGEKLPFTASQTKDVDADYIRAQLKLYEVQNQNTAFEAVIEKFLLANRKRYENITDEATRFIRKMAESYDTTEMYVSFSGGKDSTVVSSLVMRALCTEEILHIYGDTTLEFPETEAYVTRFRKAYPKTPVLTSRNKDKNFEELCEQLGPPSRVMRWCCTIFKTGAIQRKIIAENFDKMFNDGEKYAKLEDDYRIHVYYHSVGGSMDYEEQNLSNGEATAINFVYIVSVLELARRKAAEEADEGEMDSGIINLPLVLDGPFSTLSNENTSLVAKKLPEFAEQVIIFMLDKDWASSGLEEFVLPEYCYRVKKEEKANSSTIERGGFE